MADIADIEKLEIEEVLKTPNEKPTKVQKPERTFVTANFDDLCDLVKDSGSVKFLTMDKKVLSEVEIEGKKYLPPYVADLDYLLPELDEVIIEAKKHDDRDDRDDGQASPLGCPYCLELYKELREYHEAISELPHPLYYDLLTLFDFHSYLIEKFIFSPILYFFADRERGKTRTAKGLIYVARRGIMTETLREANLIRWGRDHKATLLFDLKNFAKKLEASQAEDLVYGRVERGVTASRVLFPEKGAFRDTVRFEVFGATIVTSNRMIDDIGISRTITLDMKPSDRIFTNEPTPENALELKTKLTGMRLAHLKQEFDQSPKEETGRLEDMLIGYLRMIKTLYPTKEKTFRSLKEVIRGQKKETALDSFEAQILQIIINQEAQVESGSVVLVYDLIASTYNEGKRENLHLDGRALSRITKAMGFTSKRNTDRTKRGIFYDTKLVSKLKQIYGLEDEEAAIDPDPPQTSVSSLLSEVEAKKELVEDKNLKEFFEEGPEQVDFEEIIKEKL